MDPLSRPFQSLFGEWTSVFMKQFSGNVKVPGVKDKIDENVK